jgi:hypothetical protein
VLPLIVTEEAGTIELQEACNQFNCEIQSGVVQPKTSRYRRDLTITHAIKIGQKEINNSFRSETKIVSEYIGFITLPENHNNCLEPIEDCAGKIDFEDFYNILNDQCYDFYDVAEIDNETLLVTSSWSAYHYTGLIGYQEFDQLLKDLEIDGQVFDDSVSRCDECGAWMYNDAGYTYNYRIIGCTLVGVDCGCMESLQAESYTSDFYLNNADNCIERSTADQLVENNEIQILETFIGGMVDGRGGYINGQSTREGVPSEILAEYIEKYPDYNFIFIHEESGQFQSYFSIAIVASTDEFHLIEIEDHGDAFDWAFAIWYWLSHNHEGQTSDKYAALSMSSEYNMQNIPNIDFENNDCDEFEQTVIYYHEITKDNWESIYQQFRYYMNNEWDKE